MITKSHKQIKKQLPPLLHLHLHSPTSLKRTPGPNNKREIMRPQLRLRIRGISVCISRTGEDSAARDAGVEALLAECESLERWEVVLLSGAVDCCISQDHGSDCMVPDCGAHTDPVTVNTLIFQAPFLVAGIVLQAWVVIALVEVFEDTGEDLG